MYQQPTQATETPRLEDYLAAVNRRKYLLVLCAIAGFAVSWFYLNQRAETYTSSARVVLGPSPVGSETANRLEPPNLFNESQILRSNTVVDQAIALGFNGTRGEMLSALDIKFTEDSDILTVSATTESPTRGAEIINAAITVYSAMREEASIGHYTALIGDVEARLVTATAEADAAIARLEAVGSGAGATGDGTLLTSEIQALSSERTSASQQLNQALGEKRDLERQLLDLEQQRLQRPVSAEVLSLAQPAGETDQLSRSIVLAAGWLGGLLVGVAMAFLVDRLDKVARSRTDAELALNAPTLATVPPFGFRNRFGSSALVMWSEGKRVRLHQAQEAFRRLRAAVRYLSDSEDVRSIVLTSVRPNEGKSVLAANLAVAMAQSNTQTVLVSADLRRPSLEQLFGVNDPVGLSGYLEGKTDVPPLTVVGREGLVLLPAGPVPTNPGALLSSTRFAQLVAELRKRFDMVIIDTAPLSATADAAATGQAVDGTIVVVDSNRTDTPSLLRVRLELERAGARLIGSIINRETNDVGGPIRRLRGGYRYDYERSARKSARRNRDDNAGRAAEPITTPTGNNPGAAGQNGTTRATPTIASGGDQPQADRP